MVRQSHQTILDERADDRKFEAAYAMVAAHNNYTKAEREFGLWSKEERAAFAELDEATKHYNRIRRR